MEDYGELIPIEASIFSFKKHMIVINGNEYIWSKNLHGWSLTIAWVNFAFIMIVTNRYLRGYLWKRAIWIHAISGYFVYALTLLSTFYTLVFFKWKLVWNKHLYLATPVITLTIFIVISGTY